MSDHPTTRHEEFRRRLQQGAPLLADGAMGTELYARGVYVNQCYDELNCSRPDLVQSVHLDYLKAGARIIETNTFGANRYKLAPHGLENRTAEINRRGAELAREAVERSQRDAFVAGSIGPLGRRLEPLGRLKTAQARRAFQDQAQGLVNGGVDLIIVETMVDPAELAEAVRAVREISALPVVAQITLPDWNPPESGAVIETMLEMLSGLEVDAVGVNCSIGPSKLFDAARHLMILTDLPVSIQPNAGELEHFEGRMLCRTTPEYFAEYARRMALAGVRIVGGCCGTTPAHIRAMDAALRSAALDAVAEPQPLPVPEVRVVHPPVSLPPTQELSPMAAALAEGRFLFSVEISPPRSPVVGKVLERVRQLRNAGADLVNIPDGPRASARMSAMVLAHLIKRGTGIDVILHYACRDRNILGIQSDLLGAEALGLDNILCITGDPPKLGDYPMATAVFDVDAIGLLKIADNLNHGLDLAGNPIAAPTTFHLGCGANPGALNLELELERLRRKLDSGARYVLTQPVFDEERFFHFIERLNRPDIPVLVGILPLASYRSAEFFHNEVPGMEVPARVREKLRRAANGEAAARAGVECAVEALVKCAPMAQGAYIMPPAGRVDLATAVIAGFRQCPAGLQRLNASRSKPNGSGSA